MKRTKANKAFEKIARREGVSVIEVREEIQKAIDIGMASTDPAVQAQWKRIPYRGDKPTPDEVVLYMAKKIST